MTLSPRLLRWLMALNIAGLLLYVAWLLFRAGPLLYTQEGVLYLLPCLPFFFVLASLNHALRTADGKGEPDDE